MHNIKNYSIPPNTTTYGGILSRLLKDVTNSLQLKSIHAQSITTTSSSIDHHFLILKLLKAYSNFSSLRYSRLLFDRLVFPPPTACCNAIISCYIQNHKHVEEAVEIFKVMMLNHMEVDSYTCNFVLKACTASDDYESGMLVIRVAQQIGLHRNSHFGSSAVNFLLRFHQFKLADQLFDGILRKDAVCWNSMINGYLQCGLFSTAFDLFYNMCCSGIKPTPVTLTCLVQAAEGMGGLRVGKSIHGKIIVLGMRDTLLLTSLVGMYSKMGDILSSSLVFERMCERSLVSWNTMVSGHVNNGLIGESFGLFCRLVSDGYRFDSATLVSLIRGCSMAEYFGVGKALHCLILRNNVDMNIMLSTSMVDMYSKCGELKQAYSIFERTEDRNVVLWTAMVVGFAQNGRASDACELFVKMRDEGVAANSFTLVGVIRSCSHLGLLSQGKSVHACLLRRHGFRLDAVKVTSLVDMYAKCGRMATARTVFDCRSTAEEDVVLWNSLMMGHGMHGQGILALSIFKNMEDAGIFPNESTFVALLAACSHSGLVQEGVELFSRMKVDHGIEPREKHYACLVDLLSRSGRLDEAEELTKKLPFRPGSVILEALLSGCRYHKNVEMGVRSADRVLGLGSTDPGTYIIVSNMYAEMGRLEDVCYTRRLMRKLGMRKRGGFSLVEVRGRMHSFFAADESHESWDEIRQLLDTVKLHVGDL